MGACLIALTAPAREITNQFESTRLTFNSTYNTYEGAVLCHGKDQIAMRAQPNTTLSLLTTRDARHKLSTSVQELNDLVRNIVMTVGEIATRIELI